MEKEVPENILGKIRKLIRLKESAIKIGSEGEAHAAARIVAGREHGLARLLDVLYAAAGVLYL